MQLNSYQFRHFRKLIFGKSRWLAALVVICLISPASADDISVYQPKTCAATPGDKRFIFIVDNSGSMTTEEFTQSKATVDAAISKVLTDLPGSQVAVVQYGTQTFATDSVTGIAPTPLHHYDISVPFTASLTLATDWTRHYGTGATSPRDGYMQDHLPGSLARMRLDNVWGAGGALDVGMADIVQIVFFTDALRDTTGCCSTLVQETQLEMAPAALAGFGEYDYLKTGAAFPSGVAAQFTVMSNNPSATDSQAAAAIASVGGEYTGTVESYDTDPDGPGATPRRFVQGSFSAEDTAQILSLLDVVFVEIAMRVSIDTNQEFSIDTNKATFSSDNRAFISLFEPTEFSSWSGNIKGYFADSRGITDTKGKVATVSNGIGTVFSETAQSFWSALPDGNQLLEGGVNENLAPASRTLYTNISGNTLAQSSNLLSKSNTLITETHLDVATAAEKDTLLDWLQIAPLGDPLHSKPRMVRYGSQTVVYAMTNQGLLHAIDASTPTAQDDHSGGSELWAFMPQELLANLQLHKTPSKTAEHTYGLDGHLTTWHDDLNGDGVVNGTEQILLIAGMRRGGNSYYAIDVTDPTYPVLKWQIIGGTTTGFGDLAQSWSRPLLATVKRSAGDERVLIFSGGYDAAVLDDSDKSADATGGALYMIDKSGNLIWSLESTFTKSMPAEPALMDADADGTVDRMYAADLGGNIWRIDFDNIDADPVSVEHFASLGDASNQPFFYPPSLSLVRFNNEDHIAVTLGSGDRDQPLLPASTNRLYAVMDNHTTKGPREEPRMALKVSDLFDATDHSLASSNPVTKAAAQAELAASSGWMISLDPGEKVLSKVVVFEHNLMASTYKPLGTATDTEGCTYEASAGYFYKVDIRNGNAIDGETGRNKKTKDKLVKADRRVVVDADGIPSSPSILFASGKDSADIIVNSQTVSSVGYMMHSILWYPYK